MHTMNLVFWSRLGRSLAVLSTIAAAHLVAAEAFSQTETPGVHDPVMIEAGGQYYVFATGRGIDVWSSPDLKTWTRRPRVFDSAPNWVQEMLPGFRNHIWAPDIFEHDGKFYLYYSVSAFGRNNSAIGVATNSTLDADDDEYTWVDHGQVVRSVAGRDMWNAIDAAVVRDTDGIPWMTFGSHWGGLKICRLADNLLELAEPAEWRTIAARHRYWKLDELDAGDSANPELEYDKLYSQKLVELNRGSQSGAIEAPFVFRHGDYYYLFASWDRCCRGLASTYKVVVGRARDIQGPYVDREGEAMVHGGGSLVVYGVPDSRWAALGHNAVYTFGGTDYLVCHAYDKQDEGRPKLFLEPIAWDDYGWPVVKVKE
jgi:arabinan endo-1,5-alpha-L-arabinosidase